METSHFPAAVVAVLCIAGCAGGPAMPPGPDARDVPARISLVASRFNAGETGWVILAGREGRTDVTVTVSGVPSGVGRPVHLYTGIARGRCADPPGPVEHPLTSHVLVDAGIGQKGPYTLRTSAAVDLASLQASPHAIVVKSSPADGNKDLFCGDIATARR